MKKAAILITVICAVLSLSLFFSFPNSAVTSAYAAPGSEDNWRVPEEKTYSTTTIDEDFYADRVYVVLCVAVSDLYGLSEKRLAELFSGIEYERLEDLSVLTYYSDRLLAYYEEHGFHQQIKIYLKEKTKENALATIKELEKLDYVIEAYVARKSDDFIPIPERPEPRYWEDPITWVAAALFAITCLGAIFFLVREIRKDKYKVKK